MAHKQNNFTERDLKLIKDSPSLDNAQKILLDILKNSQVGKSKSPINPNKIGYLTYQVKRARTIDQVYGILLNMFLVGEGLGVGTGTYQKMMPSWQKR
jgi:hypothetical protein